MLSENGKIPGSRPIAARKAEIGASEVTGYAQAVSITPPVRADLIKGGLRFPKSTEQYYARPVFPNLSAFSGFVPAFPL